MRPLKLWHRVGPPTWKRSGTLIFSAVMGVLLIGGVAMAANLGLLTSTASGDRGHRLEVPRPPLSVTLPTTEPAPPFVDPTSATGDVEENDGDVDEDATDDSPTAEDSTTESSDEDSDDATEPTSDDDGDDEEDDLESDDGESDDDDSDDDGPDDDDSQPERESDDKDLIGVKSDESGGKVGTSGAEGDGSLDDD